MGGERISELEQHTPCVFWRVWRLNAMVQVHLDLSEAAPEDKRNAEVKLAAFDLDRHLDFAAGAYGSDHRVRGELVAIARRRATERHGVQLDPGDVVLVGDTPLDIAAAREGGARSVGVATGPFDEEALRAAGADAVLPNLGDSARLLQALGLEDSSP